MYRILMWTLMVAFGLSGCKVLPRPDVGSVYYRLPAGTRITLNQSLDLPADRGRVFVQRGRVVAHGVNEGWPYCYFRVRDPVPVDRTIDKTVLTVTAVRRDRRDIAQLQPLVVASAGGGLQSPQTLVWQFDVTSEPQSPVTRIVCGGAFDDPALARPPGLQEMRDALGRIAAITLP